MMCVGMYDVPMHYNQYKSVCMVSLIIKNINRNLNLIPTWDIDQILNNFLALLVFKTHVSLCPSLSSPSQKWKKNTAIIIWRRGYLHKLREKNIEEYYSNTPPKNCSVYNKTRLFFRNISISDTSYIYVCM